MTKPVTIAIRPFADQRPVDGSVTTKQGIGIVFDAGALAPVIAIADRIAGVCERTRRSARPSSPEFRNHMRGSPLRLTRTVRPGGDVICTWCSTPS